MYDGHSCPSIWIENPNEVRVAVTQETCAVSSEQDFGKDSDLNVQGTKSHSTQRVKLQESNLSLQRLLHRVAHAAGAGRHDDSGVS